MKVKVKKKAKNPARMNDRTVIIIVGPTAVGKTAAAVRLAQQFSTSIISADSRQCFKELHIGVAKPSPEELAAVHHYFIDSHSIQEDLTAGTFEKLSLEWAEEIFRQQIAAGRPPVAVMVGGTGLYIKAFTEGLDVIPPIDMEIRTGIQRMYEEKGLAWLQEQIKQADRDNDTWNDHGSEEECEYQPGPTGPRASQRQRSKAADDCREDCRCKSHTERPHGCG